ncbi:cupin domain-containing protein [Amphritea pacifica]|uniref:Cupin domain-containing protein n=1 Tax=Amphritea pacifica TaxID=2811233 RepID=A0ABS2W6D2_9GAMM|nr:cupin domain-containing protein [Amphritea pacifica]MBN0987273.1 cupin domain-containing protein [Amphritea pacifica]
MLNMDFNQSVSISTHRQGWVASPMPGVWRKPLAREDAEQGHATSIVRYDPGASFSSHEHPKGEEILVLQGVFSDQSGDYAAGTYFRNPEGFSHAPFSCEGCIILVKLHQFQPDDRAHLTVQTNTVSWVWTDSVLQRLDLHQNNDEQVFMLKSQADVELDLSNALKGLELFVIEGELFENQQLFSQGCWIRRPRAVHRYRLGPDTRVWIKVNHLY